MPAWGFAVWFRVKLSVVLRETECLNVLVHSLRRDVIRSMSHFTTHRNHPMEDDYQDPH